MERKQGNEGRKEITKSVSEESWDMADIDNMEPKQENEGRKEFTKSMSEESWDMADIANVEPKQENEGRKEFTKSVSEESWDMVAVEVDALKIEDEETQPPRGQVKEEEEEVAQLPQGQIEEEVAQLPQGQIEAEEEAQPPQAQIERVEEGERSIFDRLNEDCMIELFERMSIRERLHLRQVCKHWQYVINRTWPTTTPQQVYEFVRHCRGIDGCRARLYATLKEITRHMRDIVFSTGYYSYEEPIEEYQIAYILGQNQSLRSLTIAVPQPGVFHYFKPLFERPSLRELDATLDPRYLEQLRAALGKCRYLVDLKLHVLDFWRADQTWTNVARVRAALLAMPAASVERLRLTSNAIFLIHDLFRLISDRCPNLEELDIQGAAGHTELELAYLPSGWTRLAMRGWSCSLRRLRLSAPPPCFDPTCLFELRSLVSLELEDLRRDFWRRVSRQEFLAEMLRNNRRLHVTGVTLRYIRNISS